MHYKQILTLTFLCSFASMSYGQYFDYDPDNPAEQAPIREGEKAVIPLDTGDPTYNLWQTPRDDLSEGRKPALSTSSVMPVVPAGRVSLPFSNYPLP